VEPPRPDRRSRIDEIEAELDQATPAASWQDERPTAQKIKRIEQSGPPGSYPPPSTASLVRSIRSWAKANWWLVAILGATGGTAGLSRLPWGEWLGLVSKAEHGAALAVRDARIGKLEKDRDKQAKALAAVRAGCATVGDVEALRSQFQGLDERQESVEVKPKRRR
jgi:hypothetical protein